MKASLRCWFCDVTAFTKSLIRLDNLSQPVLRRESNGPSGSSLRGVGWRVARTGRERESFTHWRLAFKQTDLAPPTGGCSNQCPCGAESRLHSSFCKAHDHSSSDIKFNVKDIHRSFISVVNMHYDAKV